MRLSRYVAEIAVPQIKLLSCSSGSFHAFQAFIDQSFVIVKYVAASWGIFVLFTIAHLLIVNSSNDREL